MSASKNTISKKVLIILLSIISVLAVLHLSLQYINIVHLNETYGPFYELTNRLDFDDESSIPTWFQQLLFLVITFGSGLIAYMQTEKAKRNFWILISILAILGSLDEVASIHENILQNLHTLFFDDSTPTLLANAWVIIVPFLLIAALIFVIKAYLVMPRRTLRLFIIGGVTFFIGSVLVDIMTSSGDSTQAFLNQGIMVSIEEILELLGLTVVVYAITEYIEKYHKTQIKNSLSALRKPN